MKVSIITTCYNRKSTIADAIRSVLEQDYPDIEYIIVDGASTDGSVEVIRKVITGYEDKVTFISESDHGMYEALNKGIRMATGEIIGICHSDDTMYAPDVVSRVVKCMEDTRAEFLYADGIYVSAANTEKVVRRWIGGKYSLWKVLHGWLPLHTTCYMRKSLIDKMGMYDEQYKMAADTDFLVRCLKRKDIKVTYLPKFVTCMRMGGMSTDSTKRRKMWKEDIRVYRGHGFRHAHLTKIEKMMWKVPQFVMAKVKGGNSK